MRGNETINGTVQSLRRIRFSIPMRGNESGGASAGTSTAAGFSIPMRGNEKENVALIKTIGPVFDPHEG